jgi:transcriptional antiterminator RfaH
MVEALARWHVVQTKAQSEAKAALNLARQGYEIYMPRYLKKRRHARKVDIVDAPLFPRYLFVAIDMATQRWRNIYSTIGVSSLVCIAGEPASVDAAVIEQLKKREDDSGHIRLDQRITFKPGAPVRVLDGAFDSCVGLCEGMTDQKRVAILLELLGRKVRVFLDVESIAAA